LIDKSSINQLISKIISNIFSFVKSF